MLRRFLCSLFLVFCTVFFAGCGEDDSKIISNQKPATSAAKRTVFVSDSTIHFFLKTFGEDNIAIRKAEELSNNEAEWKPRSGDLARLKSAEFIFVYSKVNAGWLSKIDSLKGTVVEIAATDSEMIPSYDGQAVFDPEHAAAVAKGTREALAKYVLTGESQRSRLDRFVAVVDSRFAPLIAKSKSLNNRFRPILYSSSRLSPWIGERGVSAKKIDLNPKFAIAGDVVDLTLKQNKIGEAKWIVWTEEPVAELKSSLANRGLQSVVLNPGVDPSGDLKLLAVTRANLEALAKIYDPKAKPGQATAAAPKKKIGEGDFETTILPFLDNYCIECHDADTGEGEVEFDLYSKLWQAEKVPDLWESAVELIEMGEMPPRKKDQPSVQEKEHFIEWTEALSQKWDSGAMGRDPGRITLRRLNKNEYNYTIRDLFGLKLRPADNFPEETGGEAGFDNNADALFLPPLLMENYVESAGIIVETVYRDPQARARYLYVKPTKAAEAMPAARKILRLWASRAYRKPVRKEELDRLLSIYQRSMNKEKNFSKAMQMPLLAILISPNFIYRAEDFAPKKDVFAVSDYDLASRLSYFLWSSMPDGKLFELAQNNELHKPAVLKAQVERMLKDKRSRSLSMHFGGQWFKWEDLRSTIDPDTKKFPMFTFELRVSMYQESSAFFDYLLQNNRSVLELIDSDYAFLNDRLARLYGIPGVTGPQIRKVQLTDKNRGGVLGMGSVLAATSLPLRSSPAKRGDWVLTEILGTPPPEPPMNVAQLPEDDRNLEFKTFRETLEAHREDPSCAGCHAAIDPIGFGLENFDSIGRWRTTQNGATINTSGELPDGRKFQSPAELRAILLEEKDLFVRNMAEKLLAYALGRELTPYDRPIIAKISKKVAEDDYQIHRMFLEVVQSYPFLNRRSDSYKPQRITPKK